MQQSNTKIKQWQPETRERRHLNNEELLERYFGTMDLVLVEGFRGSSLPKIEVHRKEFRHALICRGERNDPGAIAGFIASLASGVDRN